MADLGLQMLDIGWELLGSPKPMSVMAAGHNSLSPRTDGKFEVEEAATALIRFDSGKTLELAASWAMNQPPQQQGGCLPGLRHRGRVEVYTQSGAVLYRDFDTAGKCRPIALKGPKMIHHGAMMRHLKECMLNSTEPQTGVQGRWS